MKIEAIWQADTQQRVFRALVEAFSHPGEIQELETFIDGSSALRAVLATLVDGETTLADPHGKIRAADWPLLQIAAGQADSSRHVVADGRRAPDFQPMLGTLGSPEWGATVLIEIDRLGEGDVSLELTGPGIADARMLRLTGLHPAWLVRRNEWTGGFPLGVDLVLTDAMSLVALPRTTHIRPIEGRP